MQHPPSDRLYNTNLTQPYGLGSVDADPSGLKIESSSPRFLFVLQSVWGTYHML